MPVSKPFVIRVQIPAGHFMQGRRFALSQISEHHIYGDARHVLAKAQQQEYSCTYTIAMDGTIYQLVDDGDTSFCDNDYRSNGRAITIEHAGGHPNFPYTEAMYQSSILLHAWLFQTYGGLEPVRHRDIVEIKADPSKATACSGELQVERIVTAAYELLKTRGEEMITKDDIALLRIGHSEIGGWDLNRVHTGEWDELFLASWQGKPVKDFIWAQWNQHADWRAYRQAAFVAATELSLRPTQENYDKLKAALDASKIESDKIAAAANVLKAEKVDNENQANAFMQMLGSLLKRFKQ